MSYFTYSHLKRRYANEVLVFEVQKSSGSTDFSVLPLFNDLNQSSSDDH